MKILSAILLFIFFCLFFLSKKPNDIVFSNKNEKFHENIEKKIVKSLSSENVKIFLSNKIPLSIFGKIFYENEKFRLIASSFFGKELDIGSNEDFLWYWSKRSKPKALYFSSKQNLYKTNLKSALNPEWLIICLNINNNLTNVKEKLLLPQGDLLIQDHKNSLENGMLVGTLIDKSTKTIKGNYLFSANGKMIASSEVLDYQFISGYVIPKKIYIIWYAEGITMTWDLADVNINKEINPNYWIIPNISPKIDIGK